MANQQPSLPPEVVKRAVARQAAIRRAAATQQRGQQRRPHPPMRRRPRTGTPRKGMESMFGYGVIGGIGIVMLTAILMAVSGNLPGSGPKSPSTGGNKGACASAADGPTLTRFLQALAAQESGGNIRSVSNTGAKGKYQYIDSTWKSHTSKYYPPASKYSNALAAPEEYQDALAYIEYSDKYRTYGGDLFKLAISHFYPAANNDSSLLDIVPDGNIVSPRQYANQFIAKVKGGVGNNIPIKAEQAPEFNEYLKKTGGTC